MAENDAESPSEDSYDMDGERGSTPRPTVTIKLELKPTENGTQLTVKEGQTYLNHMSSLGQEEFRNAIIHAWSTGQTVDHKKVLELVQEACAFLEKENPTVKELRHGNPRAVQLLFHREEFLKGSSKIKNIWRVEHRPADWPELVPFEDPNNGPTGKKAEKLKKVGLSKMFSHLQAVYMERKSQIMDEIKHYRETMPSNASLSTTGHQEKQMQVYYAHTMAMLGDVPQKASITQALMGLVSKMQSQHSDSECMRQLLMDFNCNIQRALLSAGQKEVNDPIRLALEPAVIQDRYKNVGSAVQVVSEDIPEFSPMCAPPNVQCPPEEPMEILPTPTQMNLDYLRPQETNQPPMTITSTETSDLLLNLNQQGTFLEELNLVSDTDESSINLLNSFQKTFTQLEPSPVILDAGIEQILGFNENNTFMSATTPNNAFNQTSMTLQAQDSVAPGLFSEMNL